MYLGECNPLFFCEAVSRHYNKSIFNFISDGATEPPTDANDTLPQDGTDSGPVATGDPADGGGDEPPAADDNARPAAVEPAAEDPADPGEPADPADDDDLAAEEDV